MMQDPNLSGDTLLVGLVLAARADFGLKFKGLKQLALLAFPDGSDRANYWRAKKAFRDDIRRYCPPIRSIDTSCGAPMVRRDGACGRRSCSTGYLTDWATGEMTPHSACSRHHAWWWNGLEQNRLAKPDVVPLPPANTGGHLRVHMPEYDWPRFWRALDPSWVEHPEVKPWPKPTLCLVLGDGAADGDDARPLLTVASGGES